MNGVPDHHRNRRVNQSGRRDEIDSERAFPVGKGLVPEWTNWSLNRGVANQHIDSAKRSAAGTDDFSGGRRDTQIGSQHLDPLSWPNRLRRQLFSDGNKGSMITSNPENI